MIHWRVRVWSFLLLVSVVACTPRAIIRPPIPQPPADRSSENILALFDQRWQRAESLRAIARVTVTSNQGRYSTRQTILWHRPALLRLDTLSLFGQPVMSLVADASRVTIYYPAEGTFFQGPASAETLARTIGLPLDVQEVVPLLMGYIRPNPASQVAHIDLNTDDGLLLLRFLDGDGRLRQDSWVDPNQLLPRRVLRYTRHGLAMVDVAYRDIKFVTEMFPVPYTLSIWLPHMETEVRVQFLTVDLNPALPPAVFRLLPPAGMLISPLP